MIKGLFDRGALPALTRMVQFTEQRHGLLAHNIANIDTPYFKPADVSPQKFEKVLGDAIDRRRTQKNPLAGELKMQDTWKMRFSKESLTLLPRETNTGIMYHDQNNRDLERLMQNLAENQMAFNAASRLARNQFTMIETAIAGRL